MCGGRKIKDSSWDLIEKCKTEDSKVLDRRLYQILNFEQLVTEYKKIIPHSFTNLYENGKGKKYRNISQPGSNFK